MMDGLFLRCIEGLGDGGGEVRAYLVNTGLKAGDNQAQQSTAVATVSSEETVAAELERNAETEIAVCPL